MSDSENLSSAVLAFIVGACMVFSPATAHDIVPGAPQSKPIVIRNATLHLGNGTTIENGSILFEDGLISEVGASVRLPESAQVIE